MTREKVASKEKRGDIQGGFWALVGYYIDSPPSYRALPEALYAYSVFGATHGLTDR